MTLTLEDFNYDLPSDLIAHQPVQPRHKSRLMVVDRNTHKIAHHQFEDLVSLLSPQDVLVLNNSKVMPARLIGRKSTGGKVEVFLIREINPGIWQVMTKPGLKLGNRVSFKDSLMGEVVRVEDGYSQFEFNVKGDDLMDVVNEIGLTPTPPYINSSHTEKEVRSLYQTVYAKELGSVAAPTAGLHFSDELLDELQKKGVQIEYVTLHVGPGTFKPLKEQEINKNILHEEYFEVSSEVAHRLNEAKKAGKRIIAVGTTSTRTLESCAEFIEGQYFIKPQTNKTQIFIYPPYQFKFVDSLITNFHLPQSSLLTLISALVCAPNTKTEFHNFEDSLVGEAYKKAIEEKYRFYSFGDAMWIK